MPIQLPGTIAVGLRRAARLFADHWLPRACALCDRALAPRERGLCAPCLLELPGSFCARCPGCGLAASGGGPAIAGREQADAAGGMPDGAGHGGYAICTTRDAHAMHAMHAGQDGRRCNHASASHHHYQNKSCQR